MFSGWMCTFGAPGLLAEFGPNYFFLLIFSLIRTLLGQPTVSPGCSDF